MFYDLFLPPFLWPPLLLVHRSGVCLLRVLRLVSMTTKGISTCCLSVWWGRDWAHEVHVPSAEMPSDQENTL